MNEISSPNIKWDEVIDKKARGIDDSCKFKTMWSLLKKA